MTVVGEFKGKYEVVKKMQFHFRRPIINLSMIISKFENRQNYQGKSRFLNLVSLCTMKLKKFIHKS